MGRPRRTVALAEAVLGETGEPCIQCAHRQRCAGGMACDSFMHFVHTGRALAAGAHPWNRPNRNLYRRLFGARKSIVIH